MSPPATHSCRSRGMIRRPCSGPGTRASGPSPISHCSACRLQRRAGRRHAAPGPSCRRRCDSTSRADRRRAACPARVARRSISSVTTALRVEEAVFFDGLARSDNPELGFVGNVDGPGEQLPPAGYGVYEGPVAARLRELGLPAIGGQGGTRELLQAAIAAGHPVIIFATYGLDCAPRRHPARCPRCDLPGRPRLSTASSSWATHRARSICSIPCMARSSA